MIRFEVTDIETQLSLFNYVSTIRIDRLALFLRVRSEKKTHISEKIFLFVFIFYINTLPKNFYNCNSLSISQTLKLEFLCWAFYKSKMTRGISVTAQICVFHDIVWSETH